MLADRVSTSARTWRCVLVLVVGVAGIVAGLLAMHVVSTPAGEPHRLAAMDISTTHAMDGTTSTAETSSGCATDGCDPLHDMTAMVCTLALMAATILLIAPALTRMFGAMGPGATHTALLDVAARTLGRPPPPSLLALSVDRR